LGQDLSQAIHEGRLVVSPSIGVFIRNHAAHFAPIEVFSRSEKLLGMPPNLAFRLPQANAPDEEANGRRKNDQARMTTNHPVEGKKYQSNVAAILRNADGRILIGERLKVPGAWQFPQGGVDEGESHEEAIKREVWEEIGVDPQDYEIREKKGPYYYLFPDGVMNRGHHGKEQWYFLADFRGTDAGINVATDHPEFRAWKWIAPSAFAIDWLPEMKREVYRRVFLDFFGLRL
jgi:putative (di)nucleoside polyphosphate hydrolase